MRGPNHENRAWGTPDHIPRNAAEDHARNPRPAVGGHHHQAVRAPFRQIKDLRRRVPFKDYTVGIHPVDAQLVDVAIQVHPGLAGR